jgi:hypothetical protein
MGCCGNKAGCNEKTGVDMPHRDSLLITSESFTTILQQIANAGLEAGKIFRRFDIKSIDLQQLAKQVADLAVENAYLRSVVNLFAPTDVCVKGTEVEISFGPRHSYKLVIPLTTHNTRRELAKQLRRAADKLDKEPKQNDAQTLFSFVETAAN